MNRLRFLTEEEEARLLAELQEPQKTIVLLGLYMGLRISAEALTLKKENVDLENRLFTIEAAYSKNGQTQTVSIHSALVEPLRARISESTNEYVFPGPTGKPRWNIREAWKGACKRAGISGRVTPHIARHTFASRLGMSGANDRTIQALGRWKEPKMLQRYAHLSKEHLTEALEKLQPAKSENLVTDFTQSKKRVVGGGS